MSLTQEKRELIQEDVKDSLNTFQKNYLSNYKSAVVNKALAAAGGDEGEGEAEPERQLLTRPTTETDTSEAGAVAKGEVLRDGILVKRGAVRKNWKERYFVVRENFHIEYYEDKAKFEAGAKPKGTMVLEGYEVVTDPNARKVAFKKEQNEKLKVEEDVGEYTKYEPLTIECFHDTRRRWLVKAKNQEDFDSWTASFQEAAERSSARTLTDPLRVSSFNAAFATTAKSFQIKKKNKTPYGGSEIDMLTDLFYDKVEANQLKDVWTTLPGPPKMQKVAATKLSAFVRGIISGLVMAQWKVIDAAISALSTKIEAAVEKGIAPVAQAKANTMTHVQGKVDEKIAPVRGKVLEPLAKVLASKAQPKVAEAFDAALEMLEEHLRAYVDARKTGGEAAATGSTLDKAVASHKNLKKAFATFDKAKTILTKASDALPEEVSDKVSFEALNVAPWMAAAEQSILDLLSNAAYTLQQALAEADPASDGDSALEDTMTKAKADAKSDTIRMLAELVTVFLEPVFKTLVMDICDPLVAPIDEHIPEVAQEFLSAGGCLEEVLDSVIADVASKAAEEVFA